jgi:hypothetical protein
MTDRRLREAAIAGSLANLWYMDLWNVWQRSYDPGRLYYPLRGHAHGHAFEWAMLLNILALGATLYGLQRLGHHAGERLGCPRLNRYFVFAAWTVLLFRIGLDRHLMAALFSARLGQFVKSNLPAYLLSQPVIAAAGVALVCGLGLVRKWVSITAVVETVLLLLLPLPAVALLGAAVSDAGTPVLHAPAPLAPPTAHAARARVVWIVFDEFDSRFLFDNLTSALSLPALEAFRDSSIEATDVIPAGINTLDVMPTLLTGTPVRVDGLDADGPRVPTPRGFIPWASSPTIFSEEKGRGLNSAIIGWLHPYCRLLGSFLSSCHDYALPEHTGPTEIWKDYADSRGLMKTVEKQLAFDAGLFSGFLHFEHYSVNADAEFTAIVRRSHLDGFTGSLPRALRAACDPSLDLVLLHLPVPHPFGIYDPAHKKLSTDPKSGYVDNLFLTDDVVAQIRTEMQKAGLWERSAVLITSDHFLRESAWGDTVAWDREVQRVTSARPPRNIPYLLKMPGQNSHLVYKSSFNAVVTRYLLQEILHGEVTSAEEAVHWLDSYGRKR